MRLKMASPLNGTPTGIDCMAIGQAAGVWVPTENWATEMAISYISSVMVTSFYSPITDLIQHMAKTSIRMDIECTLKTELSLKAHREWRIEVRAMRI